MQIPDEDGIYEMYYDYNEKVQYIASHRILAMNRAEKEKVLNVSITIDEEKITLKKLDGEVIRKININNTFHIN